MQTDPQEDALKIYDRLPELNASLMEGNLGIAKDVVENIYSALVSSGLRGSGDISKYEETQDLHQVLISLTTVLYQHSTDEIRSVKNNYECFSQNILIIMLAIKLINDPAVMEDNKENLLSRFVIFSPFGLSRPYQCFPYKERKNPVYYQTSAYKEILLELEVFVISENPIIAEWAKGLLEKIKEAVWSVRNDENSFFKEEMNIEITPEERKFFALDYPDRLIHTFEKKLGLDFENDADMLSNYIPQLLLSLLIDTTQKGYNVASIAKGKLKHLIALIRNHPELLKIDGVVGAIESFANRK